MERSTAILLVLVAVVLCTCPGLFICVSGSLVVIGYVSDPAVYDPFVAGLGWLSVICGLGIAVVPGIIALVALKPAWRRTSPLTPAELDEDLPPPI
jgi:hypothetical protein